MRSAPLPYRPLLLALAGLALSVSPSAAATAPDAVYPAARQLRNQYAQSLKELAAWCDQQGLPEAAKKTRAVAGPNGPYKVYVVVPPREIGTPAPKEEADATAQKKWEAKLGRLREEYANSAFDLARRAAKAQLASLAYEMVLSALRANPDHEGVRRLMGHQKVKGQWCTPYEVKKLRGGYVYHDRFGWLPQAHVARYEQGQRYVSGKWITAEEDARLHRDIKNGWDIETEHYGIRTNLSLEAGVQLGRKLERLYRVWQQLFVRFYATQAQVIAAFEGRTKAASGELPRHQVVFFRDQADYQQFLRPSFPGIEKSVGFFFQKTGRAYFFASDPPDDRTLYHEATHQLFHQARPVAPDVGLRANFWIVEGIAMFMESLHEEDGQYCLGGFQDDRLHAARYRLLEDRFYVPLSELCGYGMARLQADPRMATLYSQAAGLTHFLAFHESGHYRDSLVAYLNAVYSGRDDAETLARLTGAPYEELDRQYRQFMERSLRDSPPTR